MRRSPEVAKTAAAVSSTARHEVRRAAGIAQAIERSRAPGERWRKLHAGLMAVALAILGLFAGAGGGAPACAA